MSTLYDSVEIAPFTNAHFWRGAELRLDSTIISVFVVCGNDFIDGVNHWRIFVAFDDGKSVCLDMVKSDKLSGYLGVLLKDYHVTYNAYATYMMDLRSGPPFSLRDVLSVLHDTGRLRYKYASTHEGCRHWVRSAIASLEEAGLLVPPSSSNIKHYIKNVWTGPDKFEEKEIKEGMFY